MLKALAIIAVGAAVGAFSTWQWFSAAAPDAERQFRATASAAPAAVRARASAPPVINISSQFETLQAAQARSSPDDLIVALEAVLREPWSAMQAVEADALLMRLAEISPGTAVETAVRLNMEPHLVAQAFLALAETSAGVALDSLSSISHPATRNAVALALLDVTGDDAQGVERVMAALPASAADSFQLEWLAQRAKNNPYDAFRSASSLPRESLKQRALTAVATAWAGLDPRGALQQADTLSGNLAQTFRLAVTREWARLNASDFLNYIETAAVVPEEFIVALRTVAVGDPELVIRIADRVPGQMSDVLKASAIAQMAQTDLSAAESYALAMPAGQARSQVIAAIGSVLAQKDPDAALEWARDVAPSDRDLMMNLTMTIASTDIDRALEFLDDPPPGIEPQLLISMVTSRAVQDPEQAAEIAGKFLQSDNLQSKAALSQFVSNWMQNQPDSALDWLMSNNAALDARTISMAASGLASRDVATAVEYIDRIPQQHRASWITQIAGQYGRAEPAAALSWVAEYQGQPFYETAFRQVLQAAAQTDPRSAAQQLSQASDNVQLGAATQVASLWAQQEPRAAVEWAAELSSDEARTQALTTAVGAWANTDLNGAISWTLSQRRGDELDQTLQTLAYRSADAGQFNRELLDGISSDQERQRLLRSVIPRLARTNPDQARDLLASDVTDDNARLQIERAIEQQAGASTGLVIR